MRRLTGGCHDEMPAVSLARRSFGHCRVRIPEDDPGKLGGCNIVFRDERVQLVLSTRDPNLVDSLTGVGHDDPGDLTVGVALDGDVDQRRLPGQRRSARPDRVGRSSH